MKLPRIIRDFSLQAIGAYGATFLQMLRGLILAALLGPAGLGTVALVNLVLSYVTYSDLGMASAVGREIPLSLGAGRDEEAIEWRSYGIVAKLVSASIVGLCTAAYTLLKWPDLSAALRIGLLVAAVVMVFQGLIAAWQVIFQSVQQFGRATTVTLATGSLSFIGGVLGAKLAGITGVFVSQLIVFALVATLCFVLGRFPARIHLRRDKFARLLKVGVPLAALTFVGYNLINIDQVMVVALLGSRALGLYTLVLYGGSVLDLLPAALAVSVAPRLLRAYGQAADSPSILRLTWRPVDFLASVLPVGIAAIWILGPAVIVRILPDYTSIFAPLRVYLVGMYFMGINLGVSAVLLALNRHRNNVPIIAACIGINVLVDLCFVAVLGLGLTGIALGSVVTYFVYWMAHTTLVRWYHGQRPARAMLANLASGWPGLVLAAVAAASWALGTLGQSRPWLEIPVFVLALLMGFARWKLGGAVPSEAASV